MSITKLLKRPLLATLALLFACAFSTFSLAPAASAATTHYYLALGDSYPFGYQPDGNLSQGYADQLTTLLKNNDSNMSLVNMACWGETSDSFLNGGCLGPQIGIPTKVTYTGPNASQMDTAKAFLQANGNSVKLVSVDVGLNDLAFSCFDPNTGDVDYNCVSALLPIVKQNDLQIVQTLKAVASPSTKFVIANSFDAYQNLLPNTILAFQQYNQVIQQVASQTHTPLVDVASAFHMNSYPNGGNPYLCPDNGTPLVWACINGDSHPTTAGYALMAATFYNVAENLL